MTRSGRRHDISTWSDPRLLNAAGSAELSPRCGLGRTQAWDALAARVHRSGGPAASASDDAVVMQARDRDGVEAEPVSKHFFGVLAEQGPDQPGLDAAASRQWGGPVTRHTPACEQMYSSAASRAPIRCGWPVTNGWAIVQHFLAQQSK